MPSAFAKASAFVKISAGQVGEMAYLQPIASLSGKYATRKLTSNEVHNLQAGQLLHLKKQEKGGAQVGIQEIL